MAGSFDPSLLQFDFCLTGVSHEMKRRESTQERIRPE